MFGFAGVGFIVAMIAGHVLNVALWGLSRSLVVLRTVVCMMVSLKEKSATGFLPLPTVASQVVKLGV